jgi:plastocyanin
VPDWDVFVARLVAILCAMKTALSRLVFPSALALSLAACGGGSQPVPRPASGSPSAPRPRSGSPATPTARPAAEPGEVEDGGASNAEHETPAADAAAVPAGPPGRVSGVVTFEGTPPVRRELAIRATPGCEHEDTPLTELVVVTDGKLANVFVYVSKGLKGWVPGPAPAALVLDQRGCMYRPHVSGAMVDQVVMASNSDPVSHNVHVISKRNDSPNKTQSAGMKPLEIAFENEEVPVIFVCDIHPWMKAYVCVQDHPFFAVSGTDGAFSIPNLPPGKYTLTAWHEKYGKKKSGSITVAPDGESSVSFQYP